MAADALDLVSAAAAAEAAKVEVAVVDAGHELMAASMDEVDQVGPTLFRVAEGVVFLRPAQDPCTSQATIRKTRPCGSKVYCTGRLWRGMQGGLWAQLDPKSPGRSSGWIFVEGPGFGFSTPLLLPEGDCVTIQISSGKTDSVVAEASLPRSATVGNLAAHLGRRFDLDHQKIRLTKALPGAAVAGDPPRRPRGDVLENGEVLGNIHFSGPLALVYLGEDRGAPAKATSPSKAKVAGNAREVPKSRGTFKAFKREESAETFAPASDDARSEEEDEESAVPTGDDAHFEVLYPNIAARRAPSTAAASLGGLPKGRVIYGAPYKFDDVPWLRLGAPECRKARFDAGHAWVLIHGSCVGLGQLLRRVSPEEVHRLRAREAEEDRSRATEAAETAAAAKKEAEARLKALQEERGGLEARRSALEAKMDELNEAALAEGGAEGDGAADAKGAGDDGAEGENKEVRYKVIPQSVAVRATPSTFAKAVGGLGRGRVVKGVVCSWMVGGPWLRLNQQECKKVLADADEGWVLIDGSSLGKGKLLRRLSPAEEEAQRMLDAEASLDSERLRLKREAEALEKVIREEEAKLEQARAAARVPLDDVAGRRGQRGGLGKEADVAEDMEEALGEPEALFEVVSKSVAVRDCPSIDAETIGGLPCGRVVGGWPEKIAEDPWLRIGKAECKKALVSADEAWVLIHGGSIGMGQLLRRLTPEEEEQRRREASQVPAAVAEAPPPERPEGEVSSWGIEEVVTFLSSLSLGHLHAAFRENGIDGPMLAGLTEAELCEELGLTKLQAKKITKRLAE